MHRDPYGHAVKRYQKRYGFRISRGYFQLLCRELKHHKRPYTVLKRQRNHRVIIVFSFRRQTTYAVYDETQGLIITFLTEPMALQKLML